MSEVTKKRHKVFIRAAIILLIAALAESFVLPLFLPWSEWNCRHQEIDLSSGRKRFTHYRFHLKISERVEETEISQALPPHLLRNNEPDWKKVNTFSPGSHHSPHYIYHSAYAQLRNLTDWWEMSEVPSIIKAKTAQDLLAIWKYSGSDDLAKDYLRGLYSLFENRSREAAFSILESTHIPLLETNYSTITLTLSYPDGTPLLRSQNTYGSDGKLIKNGEYLTWRINGKINYYTTFKNGEIDGYIFDWDESGILTGIRSFREGELREYESKNLTQHPAFSIAERIIEANKLNRQE